MILCTCSCGSSDEIDDLLSRVRTIAAAEPGFGQAVPDADKYAEYAYLGAASVVSVAHPAVAGGLKLEYGSAGSYPGLDRFGRVVRQTWTSGGTEIDSYRYGYDRNSNRLYRRNEVNALYSELYHADGEPDGWAYDRLNRLEEFRRGTLSADNRRITGDPARSQDWTLDQLGNWAVKRTHLTVSRPGAAARAARTLLPGRRRRSPSPPDCRSLMSRSFCPSMAAANRGVPTPTSWASLQQRRTRTASHVRKNTHCHGFHDNRR